MGNSTLQAAFKQYRRDRKDGAKADQGEPQITSAALLLDEPELVSVLARYVREAMHANSDVEEASKPGGAILATNQQTNSDVEDLEAFQAEKALAAANAGFICGFKTAESNIEDLQHPAHEKYFAVSTEKSTLDDYQRVQGSKVQILYGLYLLRQKTSASTKQTFAEYVQKFLKDSTGDAEQLQPRPNAGIQAGFGFLMVLLREMKTINQGALLVKSLEHFHQILKQAEPGSFHTGDKLSFVLDSNLNEARAFLLELIEEQATDKRVLVLAVKILFMLGLARGSVEDLLTLTSVLTKTKHVNIDLRAELRILRDLEAKELASISKDEDFDSGEAQVLGKGAVKMPICNSGGNGIKIQPSKDSWVLDGGFFYAVISGRGLVKLQTGTQGGMPGRVVAMNPELDKPDASLMVLDGKLYLRHGDIKPAPFVIIDKQTLQEVKVDPELKFEPKEGETRSIQWTEPNEETGRTLGATPLVTDGTFVYVIAVQGLSKAEKEEATEDTVTAPKLAVEVYDPAKNFEFVRAVTLYKNSHLEPYAKESTASGLVTWASRAQWATNGSVLACFASGAKVHFFSLETGVKVSKEWLEPTMESADFDEDDYHFSDYLVVYDYVTNQFVALDSGSPAGTQQIAFDFPNFKRASSKGGSCAHVDKLEQKYLAEDAKADAGTHRAPKELNLIEQIMQNVSIADLAKRESHEAAPTSAALGGIPSAQASGLTRSLILRFLSRRCRGFRAHLAVASQGSARDAAAVMSVFRYPFVTYLTKTTFMELGHGLQAFEALLATEGKGNDDELHELYGLYFLLELASANFKALNFCSLSLKSLLSQEADYKQFMSTFQRCVGRLAEESGKASSEEAGTSEEMKSLWGSIKKVGQEIMACSISLLHEGPSEILVELRTALGKDDGQRCRVQIAHLAQIEQLRLLMGDDQAKGGQRLQDVLEAFSGVASLESKMIKAELEQVKLDQADGSPQPAERAEPALTSACQEFLLNFSEEVASQICASTEQLRKRSQAAGATQANEEANIKLKALEKAVCKVAEVCFNELSGQFDLVLGELLKTCDAKTEDSHWEGVSEKFKRYSTAVSSVFGEHNVFYQVAMLYTQAFSIHRSVGQPVTQAICRGAVKAVESVSLLHTIWKKYGEKLGLGEDTLSADSSALVDATLQQVVAKLRRHLSWYMGHIAYELIKIEKKPEPEPEKNSELDEQDEHQRQKKKEDDRKQVLQMVLQSNLLSGGIGAGHLSTFSKEAKEQLIGYASRMDDDALLEALEDNNEKGSASALESILYDDDRVLEAILQAGKDAETDLTIEYLQRILEAIPMKDRDAMVPFARLGGADGLRLSRAAFAVMVKFSDLLDDFTALVDAVAMQAALEEGNPGKDEAMMATIRAQPQADVLMRRWESAARMRQWINEKKQATIRQIEKDVAAEVRAKKAEEQKKAAEEKEKLAAEEAKKKEEAAKEGATEAEDKRPAAADEEKKASEAEPEAEQIDSSTKPASKAEQKGGGDDGKKKSKKDKELDEGDKKGDETKEEDQKKDAEADSPEPPALTAEEERYVADEAFRRLEKMLEEIFTKIQAKAQFMTRLNIPLRFKRQDPTRMKDGQLLLLRAPSSFEGLPQPKLDWEGRLKSWKQMQTSRGAIKSLTERKAEIWNSGITSILALLQTAIDGQQIQKQVEKTYVDACRRTAGLKLVRDLLVREGSISALQDVVGWFSAALRCNKNRLTHYLDDAKGQGIHLESQSRKYFFEILGALVQRLKVSKDQKEIKSILDALKWKYTGRDHGDLAQLKIFGVLHRGNGEKDNKLRQAWGRKVSATCDSVDGQSLSKDVLELFEHLFLTVAGRIVEPDFCDDLKLKSSGGTAAPQLQKAKSVIDENASETLLGQAFEVVFREIERYLKIISGFKGVDWGMYVQMRNKERKEEATPQELNNQEDPLLDEVEEEAEEGEKKEEEDKKQETEEVTKSQKGEDGKADENKQNADDAEESKKEQQPSGEEKVADAPDQKEEPKEREAAEAKDKTKGEPAKEQADKKEDGDEDSDKASDENADDGEEGSDKGEADEEAAQRDEVKAKSKEREERELKQLPQLYSESFLQRLLRLVEIFTSIATCSSHPLSMVQRVANPYHLSSLLNLLLLASPSVKILVLKILQHIVRISLPFEVFEEAVRILTRDENSLAHRILHKIQPSAKFESSMFLKFLFNYLLSLRSKMWRADAESEGQYAVSRTLSATLRVLGSVQGVGACWSRALKEEIAKALKNIETLPVDEADGILSLLPGGEFGGITAGDHALTSKDQLVTVLGYSTTWKPAQALLRPGEQSQALKSLRLSPEFTDPAQQVVALFYDEAQKARQDLMQLHPSSLSPIAGLDADEALSAATSSPLMDRELVIVLIRVLKMNGKDLEGFSAEQLAHLRSKQSQILMTISSQIEVLGKTYIDFLQKEELLVDLMAFLYRDIADSDGSAGAVSKQVVPVKWLEAKLQRMRKLAIETPRSLSLAKEETQAFLLDKKELIFKRTDPVTNNVSRVNAYLTSAVNLHKVAPDTLFQCSRSSELPGLGKQSSQVVKNGLVTMPFSELEALSPRALQILHQSDAVMTTQREDLDVKALFKKILEIYKTDSEKTRKYSNLLETVIFFVSEEDYERCTKPSEPIAAKASSMDANQSQLGQLLEDLSQWGGVDKDQILCYLQEGANKDMDAALNQVEEGLVQMQAHDQKYQEDLVKSKKNNDLEAIKKLEVGEDARKKARNELIEEKKKLLLNASAQAGNEIQETQNEEAVEVFDAYEKDEVWWKELKDVVEKKFVAKLPATAAVDDNAESKKNDEQMTKLLYSIMTDFDASQLQFEYAKAVEQMLVEQRKDCLFAIINVAQQGEVLPGLLKSEGDRANFSKFLKMQFNSSVIQLLQVGQKKSYQQIKQKLRDIFGFCSKSEDFKQFTKTFLLQDVLKAGVKTVRDLRIAKIGKVADYFQVEERAVTGLNPYLLRFVTQYLVKEGSLDLLVTKNCISTLLNLHLCMVLYFQEHKVLVCKLLKSSLKLLCFAKKHCGALVRAGELPRIVENQLVKLATSQIDFKDQSQGDDGEGKKLTNAQLLFLEIHLKVDELQSQALESYQLQTIKVLEDSEAICRVKRNKQLLKEADSFDVLMYLYHLEHLDDDQKALMNVTVETSHPAFDAMTRALIDIPEVQRVKIKFKDTMKLKDFTYVGISNSPNSDITLKSLKDKEFEWASGRFYLFYPVQQQNIIGFGQNGSNQLGAASESFKTPQISMPEVPEGSSKFRPVRVYGRGQYSVAVTSQGMLYETGSMEGGGTSHGKFTKVASFKEKVRFVAIAKTSAMVVLENNQIFYRGESIDHHFPNDEWKGAFTRLKLWSDSADEQKIVDITSGHGFTLAVTDAGNLWGWGRRFLEAIGQESNTPKQLKLPRGQLCRRVWAATGTESPCAFIELEDSESGAKAIYSAGKSEKGLLGQGVNVKESRDFKKIQLGAKDVVFTQMSLGAESAIAIDSEGLLWGWGHNDQQRLGLTDVVETGIPRPMKLYSLNQLAEQQSMKAKKASCGSVHSLIMFENKQGKELLYSVGIKIGSEYAHLGVEEDMAEDQEQPFREVATFNDRNVVDFLAHDQASLVIIGGGATDADSLYAHKLPEGKKAKGLLHLYKQNGEWKFVTEEDYEQKKAELPDLCFAIKCPIENLTSLDWPDLEAIGKEIFEEAGPADAAAQQEGAEQLAAKTVAEKEEKKDADGTNDGQKVKGETLPLYHSRCFINHEEVEVNHTEKTILEDDLYSMNPLIFFRVAKPMKKDAKLPSIDLEKFYKQDSPHGLDLEIVPDLTHQKNKQLIKLTQANWDEILENDSKFDAKFKIDLLRTVDASISSIVNEKAIKDVNFEKEVKMGELKFKEKGLKRLNEKAKKQKASLYWMLNTFFFALLPYVTKETRGITGTAYELVNALRTSLLSSMKAKYIKEQIDKLPEGSTVGVKIKRAAAQRFADQGKCDHDGEHMIFGQIFQHHKKDDSFKGAFKRNGTDSQMFSVSLAGEGSIDVGGPFREALTNVVVELETDALPLLIKTPNNRNDHGSSRDCFILNPASTTPTHSELFIFMGYFLGFAIRSQSAMNWHFPPIFWKQLLGETVTLNDLEGLDAYSWQILQDIQKHGASLKPADFDAAVSETFETYLSNGTPVELCPGGKDKAVTHANHKEFVELVAKTKLAEYQKQMEWLKQGVSYVLDVSILSFLTWEEVELRACGAKDIETAALKAITDTAESKWVKMFWEMFDTFTQEERRKYLKFVWGRVKLPADTSTLGYRHEIAVRGHMAKDALPEAHTCFFTIDIPEYENLEIMGKRFRTAIELCGEIDADYGADDIADEDGNRGAGGGGYDSEEEE